MLCLVIDGGEYGGRQEGQVTKTFHPVLKLPIRAAASKLPGSWPSFGNSHEVKSAAADWSGLTSLILLPSVLRASCSWYSIVLIAILLSDVCLHQA